MTALTTRVYRLAKLVVPALLPTPTPRATLRMKTMDASKVRKSFARVLESVRDDDEVFVVVRYGQPLAALVPLDRLSPSERKVLDRPSAVRRRVAKNQR